MTGEVAPKLVFSSLDHADAIDIEDLLADAGDTSEDIRLTEQVLSSNRLGEPVTFFLVATATVQALQLLGAFLMKRRKRSRVHYSVQVELPDGTKTSQVLDLAQSDSEAPDPDVIAALTKLSGLPTKEIADLLKPGP